jgi:hypothetical protein
LPPVFVERFATSSPDTQMSAYTSFVQIGARSPIHFFHALALLRCTGQSAEIRQIGSSLITKVLARWEELANAVGALLMWSETQAHELQDWRTRSVEEQLVSTWYHAARLMCIFNRRLDMDAQIADRFAGLRNEMSADVAFGGLTRSLDCASPNTFIGVVLLYGGMRYALQPADGGGESLLSKDHQEKVLELTRVNNHVNPWLIASRELSANCLDSFLCMDTPLLVESFALPATLAEDFERELINAIKSAPGNPMVWIHLYTLTRMGLSAANHHHFVEIVANARLTPLAELGTDVLIAWRSLAGCVRLLGDDRTRNAFKAQFVLLAESLADRYKGSERPFNVDEEDERARRLNELLEACITFSRCDDIAQAYGSIAELFVGVADVWKAARPTIRKALETIFDESRISENGAVWNALVRLRAQT